MGNFIKAIKKSAKLDSIVLIRKICQEIDNSSNAEKMIEAYKLMKQFEKEFRGKSSRRFKMANYSGRICRLLKYIEDLFMDKNKPNKQK